MANNYIDHFFSGLHPEEVKSVRRYIRNNLSNSEESKSREVFEAMLSGKELLYANKASLYKIKSRVFELGLEGLMIDEYILSKNSNQFDRLFFKTKKQLLCCTMLSRNRTENKIDAINHLINNIIKVSKKNQMFPLTVEALALKKYFIGPRLTIKEFEKINEELKYYAYCNEALYNTTDDYFRLITTTLNANGYSKKRTIIFLKSAVKNAKNYYSKTKAIGVNYYLHILKFALLEQQKDYSNAVIWCAKLVKLLQKNKIIYKPERLGYAYDNLSLYYTYLSDYKKAIEYINKAKSLFVHNSINENLRLEQELYVHFYFQKYDQALICLNSLKKISPLSLGHFSNSKHKYIEACIYFSLYDYKKASAILSTSLEIEKDKERWNVAVKIVTILICIELGKLSQASRTLAALQKFFRRNKTNDKIRPRDVLIAKALREFEKGHFEFNEKNVRLKTVLKKLSSKNQSASWEYYSPELIKFHEWLEGKRKKQTTRNVLP